MESQVPPNRRRLLHLDPVSRVCQQQLLICSRLFVDLPELQPLHQEEAYDQKDEDYDCIKDPLEYH